MMVTGNYQS